MGNGRGVVAEFSNLTGLGIIAASDGSEIAFHCIQIADGSRFIDVGTPVGFSVFPAMKGRVEAMKVEKL
ncbi:MAG: cold shock domain-containing protein [Acidimicrobiaceae bacterium]|nr:cold shock domain-containing protein [Acidimicrobiaceae bacterium]